MFDWKPAKKKCGKKKRTLGNKEENSSGVIETNCKELWVLKMQLFCAPHIKLKSAYFFTVYAENKEDSHRSYNIRNKILQDSTRENIMFCALCISLIFLSLSSF